ncbi:hypothetical protein ONZ45_g10776 [Pleurotus djamor]|nr:hypothetical protein ONZ45_g10776 [Pleurotus djamor]
MDARHNAFYYLDFSTFKVEDELFRIPTYYLKAKSEVFNQMFLLPSDGEGSIVEGQSDASPIVLEGVNKSDFQSFLAVILQPFMETGTMPDSVDWLSVLKLANMWGFTDLRKMAISNLSKSLSRSAKCGNRIQYGRTYKVEKWVRSGYIELLERESKITEEEGEILGWRTLLTLCNLREDRLKSRSAPRVIPHHQFYYAGGTTSTQDDDPSNSESAQQILKAFTAELTEIASAGSALEVPAPAVRCLEGAPACA